VEGLQQALSKGTLAPHAAQAYTSNFDPTSGNLVTLDGVDFDTDDYFNLDANGFVIPADLEGAYLFTLNVFMNSSSAPSKVRLWIDFTDEPNLSNPETDCVPLSGNWSIGMVAMGQFAAGSTLTLHVAVTGGTNVTMAPAMGLTYIGSV
jgi:hypothetical protein